MRLLFSFLAISFCYSAMGQTIATNIGDTISILPGTLMTVEGGFWNKTNGKFFHAGELYIRDSVINTAGNTMFINSLPGAVRLYGANQVITGTDVIHFPTLELKGTGVKSLDIHAIVEDSLILNDKEFYTKTHTLFCWDKIPNHLTRTSGFVHSDNGGWLQRAMNQTQEYLFPVGISGKYRPVKITPSIPTLDSFAVRFANVNATVEGFNINDKDTTLCQINPDYYHQIRRTTSNFDVDLDITFDPSTDLIHETIAQWSINNLWQNRKPVITNPTSLTKQQWALYQPYAFAFGLEKPEASFSANFPDMCTNDSLYPLVANPAGGVFSGTGVVGNMFNPALAGPGIHNLIYEFQAVNGCKDTAYSSILVNQAPNPIISGTATEVCAGTPVILSAGANYLSYEWTDASGTVLGNNQTLTVSVTGDYSVKVDSGQCSALSQSFHVLVKPYPSPIITPSRNTNLCAGENINLDAGSGYQSYTWTQNGQVVGNTQVINTTTAGIFTVTVDSNGCTTESSPINITVRPLPEATIQLSGPEMFCEGDSVILTASTADAWIWTPTGETTQSIVVKTPGTYNVTISDSCGTDVSADILVTVNPNPEAGFTWSPTPGNAFEPMQFSDSSSQNVISWLWEFGDSVQSTLENPAHTYTRGDTFDVKLTVSTGFCEDVIVKKVIVLDQIQIYIPNAFTPDDDGINETFQVVGVGVKDFHIEIFNRWGTRLFVSNNIQNSWDGKINGQYAPEGVYVYVIKALSHRNQTFDRAGSITLIR